MGALRATQWNPSTTLRSPERCLSRGRGVTTISNSPTITALADPVGKKTPAFPDRRHRDSCYGRPRMRALFTDGV